MSMVYSELVKKACKIMFKAHKDDLDKGGYPYVFHPFFLALQMDDEISTIVALLHDVIEDHGDKYSFDYLEKEGFPSEVIDALKLLTHEKNTPYMDYIKAISSNSVASKIKLADLKHNTDLSRVNGKKPGRYDTYLEAIDFLSRNKIENNSNKEE